MRGGGGGGGGGELFLSVSIGGTCQRPVLVSDTALSSAWTLRDTNYSNMTSGCSFVPASGLSIPRLRCPFRSRRETSLAEPVVRTSIQVHTRLVWSFNGESALSLYVSRYLLMSLCVCVCVPLFLDVSLFLCLSISPFLCFRLSVCLSVSFFLCFGLSICLSISLFVCFGLSFSLFLSFGLSVLSFSLLTNQGFRDDSYTPVIKNQRKRLGKLPYHASTSTPFFNSSVALQPTKRLGLRVTECYSKLKSPTKTGAQAIFHTPRLNSTIFQTSELNSAIFQTSEHNSAIF